jgi:hypothetical protein
MKVGIVAVRRGTLNLSPLLVSSSSSFIRNTNACSGTIASPPSLVGDFNVIGMKKERALGDGSHQRLLHLDVDIGDAEHEEGCVDPTASMTTTSYLASATTTLNSITTEDEKEAVFLRRRRRLRWQLLRRVSKPPTDKTAASKPQPRASSVHANVPGQSREAAPRKRSIATKDEIMRLTGLTSISPVRSSKRPRFQF